MKRNDRKPGRQQYLCIASKWNSMIFIFLLAEGEICKDLLEDRKYMADEEISEHSEHVSDMPKESKTVRGLLYIFLKLKESYCG